MKRLITLFLITFVLFCNIPIVYGDQIDPAPVPSENEETVDNPSTDEEAPLTQAKFTLHRKPATLLGTPLMGTISSDVAEGMSDEEKSSATIEFFYSYDNINYQDLNLSTSVDHLIDFAYLSPAGIKHFK